MDKKRYKIIGSSLLTMIVLLLVRIIFFLKDGTNDTIEAALIIIIFVLSIITLGYYTYFKIDNKQEFIKKYYDKLLLVGFIFIMEILFKLSIENGISLIYIFTLLLGISLVTLVSCLLPKKGSRIFDIIFAVFFFIYVIGQDIYYTLFSGLFSFKDAVNAGEGADFATGIYRFSIFHVLYFIIFSVFIMLYLKHKDTTHIKVSKKKILLILEAPFFLFLLVNLNATYPVKSARLHTSDHYLYYSNFDSSKLASKFSLIDLFYRDLGGLLTPSLSTRRDIEYVDNYFETHQKVHQDNDYTNIFQGKNLIFILAESYDDLALSEELTPNIYKLQSEGLDFANHYTPVYPRTTCDTEIILNTGLIPSINDGPTCYMFNSNSYDNSIATLFNNSSYETTALHSNNRDFYTRDVVYKGLGYDSFLGQEDVNLTETEKRYDGIFATKAKDDIIKDNPFFSFVITLSGHSPYQDSNLAVHENYDLVDDFYGDTMPQSVKSFIATQVEVDKFVGNIMAELEAKNQLDDTVIVFANDHYPYTLNQTDYESVTGKTSIHEKQQGSLYVWSKDIEQKTITRLSSSFDIIPTISNMFGLNTNYSEYVGNDVFDETQTQLVYFKDYTVYDGVTFFSITDETLLIDDEKYDLAKGYYDLSIKILKTNYYNRLIN